MMATRPAKAARTLLSMTLSLLLLAQGLVPAGYMPAEVGQGGWIVQLCPNGLPSAFLSAGHGAGVLHHRDAAHAHHHDGSGADHNPGAASTDFCPVGSALDTSAVSTLVASLEPAAASSAFSALFYEPPALAKRREAGDARAPPIT